MRAIQRAGHSFFVAITMTLAMLIVADASLAAGFAPAAPLHTKRQYHSVTSLADGTVLVAGGYNEANDGSMATLGEVYDRVGNSWTDTGSMQQPRYAHTATRLGNGTVFAVGGGGLTALFYPGEIYTPSTHSWSTAASLQTIRFQHTATLLPSGKVLVAGGRGYTTLAGQCEVFNASGTARDGDGGSLNVARSAHTATLLPSGKVLVAGGFTTLNQAATNTAELYDPASNTWTPTAPMHFPRGAHSASLLPSGLVLVAGGEAGLAQISTAELYDPSSATWHDAGSLLGPRSLHTATVLASGNVLVSGGLRGNNEIASAEYYIVSTDTWTSAGSMANPRSRHDATLLSSGQVLIAAGAVDTSIASATADLYTPLAATSLALNSDVPVSSYGQVVTLSATVSGNSPTGSVAFKDGATMVCAAATVSANVATCATSTLGLGAHTLTAIYSGDSTNFAAASPGFDQYVNRAQPTLQLVADSSTTHWGDSVAMSVVLSNPAATGNVIFYEGPTNFCQVPVTSGAAQCAISSLAVGSHDLRAYYVGDTFNRDALANVVTHDVTPALSSTSLASTPNPNTVGQSIVLSATVGGQALQGTVDFFDGANTLCAAAALAGATATCTSSALGAGTHALTARYNGDGNHAESTSNALQQITQGLASVTQLSSPCMRQFVGGQPFQLSAQITAGATGSVDFVAGAQSLCSHVPLSGGTALCNTNALVVMGGDAHTPLSLTAAYSGDAQYAASLSPALTIDVLNAADVLFRNGLEAERLDCPIE